MQSIQPLCSTPMRATAGFVSTLAMTGFAVLAFSSGAWGQTDTSKPTQPPETQATVVDNGDKSSAGVGSTGAAIPGLTLPTMTTLPPDDGGGSSEAGYIPTQQTLMLSPGVNQIIPIAKGHLNRIITPFAHPVIHTTSTAKISTEGSIMYVASTAEGPSTLYVSPSGNQQLALSLTLVPRAIPPREIRLMISGNPDPVRAQPMAAGEWEQARPYIKSIKQAMRKLALGEIPSGYGLREWEADDPAMVCGQPDIKVEPGQVLPGSEFILLVGVATNTTARRIEINEARCRRPGVLAVAAWPFASVPAGASTELYMVMRRPSPADDTRDRPSLLDGKE